MDEFGDEFRSINHCERMMRKMEDYVNKNTLCDVILVAGTKRIPAHRLVLTAASDYFAAMFTSDVREASMNEIKMKDVDPEALAALVNYTYTGKLNVLNIEFTYKLKFGQFQKFSLVDYGIFEACVIFKQVVFVNNYLTLL